MTNWEFMQATEAKVKECWAKLQAYRPQYAHVEPPKVTFDLRGKAAGQAQGATLVRINMGFVAKNADDMLNQTVPHEVAHCFTSLIDPWCSHGPMWQRMMFALGLSPRRCHQYDMVGVAKGVIYTCGCPGKRHLISTRRHNLIRGGRKCRCKRCLQDIKFEAHSR